MARDFGVVAIIERSSGVVSALSEEACMKLIGDRSYVKRQIIAPAPSIVRVERHTLWRVLNVSIMRDSTSSRGSVEANRANWAFRVGIRDLKPIIAAERAAIPAPVRNIFCPLTFSASSCG
jgi:hypothetical protein